MDFGQDIGRITVYHGSNVRDRVRVMFLSVAKSIRDPLARTILADCVRDCPERDEWCEVQAIYWYFRNHLRYTGDTREIDTYHTLRRSVELGIADCDCYTIALMSVLISGGYRAGAKTISQDGKSFNHVYAVVELPKETNEFSRRIIGLDGTVSEAYPGWEPPGSMRKLERIFWYSEGSE